MAARRLARNARPVQHLRNPRCSASGGRGFQALKESFLEHGAGQRCLSSLFACETNARLPQKVKRVTRSSLFAACANYVELGRSKPALCVNRA